SRFVDLAQMTLILVLAMNLSKVERKNMEPTDRTLKFAMFALALTLGAASCNQTPSQNSQAQNAQTDQTAQTVQPAQQDQGDPAASNMAPVAQPAAAPQEQAAAPAQAAPENYPQDQQQDQEYSE